MKALLFLTVLVLILVGGYFGYMRFLNRNIKVDESTEGIRIQGKIDSVYNNLGNNGNCGFKIGDYDVILRYNSRYYINGIASGGTIEGVSCIGTNDDISNIIGKKVEIFGRKDGNTISIDANNSYFIKVL